MAKRTKEKTIRLTMAQAICRFLVAQYSERDGKVQRFIPSIFGIFGHGNVAGLGQAILEYSKDLTYCQGHNEQSMVHAAAAFAKERQRLQTFACTSSVGPGATNMITGAAAATINCLPVLLLPGDYYTTRHQGPVLQQVENPTAADISVNDCFRPVSRYFDRVTRPEHLLTCLPEAMRVMTSPAEAGAVVIAIPQDIQAHAWDYPANFFEQRIWRIERPLPQPQRIREAIRLLQDARRPMVIAGGGVHYSQAWKELQGFCDRYGIPVAETFAGKGAIRENSPMLLGGFGMAGSTPSHPIAEEADLVLHVGTRLTDFTTGSQSAWGNPDVRFIGINISGYHAFKQGALPIVADARETLRALIDAGRRGRIKTSLAYQKKIRSVLRAWEREKRDIIFADYPGEPMSQVQVLQALNQSVKPGDTVVSAAGTPPADFLKLWDATGGRDCHIEFGYSCMGYELPGGVGTRMARKKGEVYVFIGDGTYLLLPTDLIVALQEGLKMTVILSENHGYQSIHALQRHRVRRSFGNEFRHRKQASDRLDGKFINIDLAKNAESMGARSWNVGTIPEFKQALAEARRVKESCVIVCEVDTYRQFPGSGIWWDVAAAEVSRDAATRQSRREYERERAKFQRYYYHTPVPAKRK